MRLRQEVLNVVLAECLQQAGLAAVPEQILRAAAEGKSGFPDVIVDFQGLRLAIEGEFATTLQAEAKAVNKAAQRVEDGLAHVGIGVVYPAEAASWTFYQLRERLCKVPLQYAVATELPESPRTVQGTVQDLAEALRRAYDSLAADEALQRAAAVLQKAIDDWVVALNLQPGSTIRCAQVLGMRKVGPDERGRRGPRLDERQRTAVNKVGGLVLVNAMIFQEILSQADERVVSVHELLTRDALHTRLIEHWQFILDEINYYPIFHVACALLRTCSTSKYVLSALQSLASSAKNIVGWRAALRHDLMGRVYHLLLEEAKYLGAYYTSIPAAILLMKLALSGEAINIDWSDLRAVSQFRLADLACGTGTLLMAAADAIVDNHVRACVAASRPPRLEDLHRILLQDVIWGLDVLPSALHLTASTLALRSPEVPVNVTNLYSLPLGGPGSSLGTLEFLYSNHVPVMANLFGAPAGPERIVGPNETRSRKVELPPLDACVMNPPFTRSVGGNLLFGNFPEKERQRMQRRLREGIRRPVTEIGGGARGLSASVTAGLGAVFMALADRKLDKDGVLAVVLPQGLLSGVAWGKTRNLVAQGYHIEYVIVSHEPGQWNFSENTDLSECLLVARKSCRKPDAGHPVTCVNLWQTPRKPIEALAIARQLHKEHAPSAMTGQGALQLRIGRTKVGEALAVPQATLQDGLWQFGCAFAQSELVRAFLHLREGQLYLPGQGTGGIIPLAPLSCLVRLGPDRRDVWDGFEEAPGETPFPAFWGHHSDQVVTLRQTPNRYLSPLPGPRPGRPLRKVDDLWPKAGRLLIAERLGLNTDRVAAVWLPVPALANVWWPARLKDGRQEGEGVLALWLNSTIGLVLTLGYRGETCGAWCQWKKPTIKQVPVLDIRQLTPSQWHRLSECFREIADTGLQPFPAIEADPVRAAIDTAMSEALGLPDVTPLRALLAREPVVCLDSSRLSGP